MGRKQPEIPAEEIFEQDPPRTREHVQLELEEASDQLTTLKAKLAQCEEWERDALAEENPEKLFEARREKTELPTRIEFASRRVARLDAELAAHELPAALATLEAAVTAKEAGWIAVQAADAEYQARDAEMTKAKEDVAKIEARIKKAGKRAGAELIERLRVEARQAAGAGA